MLHVWLRVRPRSATVKKRHINLHGEDIAYYFEGSGPALLLIHGMAGDAVTWDAVIPKLAERFTIIAPDLIGHGDSAKARADYSLGGFATGLRDLLLVLGVDRVTVVGQSFGGGVAMQFTHQFPEMVERLVLVGAGGLGRDVNPLLKLLSVPGAGWILVASCRKAFDGVARGVTRLLARLGRRSSPAAMEMARSYASLTDPATRRSFLHTLRSVIDAQGQRVSALDALYLSAELPTLIMWGDADPILPVAQGRDAHAQMPWSRLEIFPGVGHFPHCEAPERFNEVLLDFIATSAPRPMTVTRRRELLLAAG